MARVRARQWGGYAFVEYLVLAAIVVAILVAVGPTVRSKCQGLMAGTRGILLGTNAAGGGTADAYLP